MLRLEKDIRFSRFNRDEVNFTFEILDQAAVDQFLANTRLITFLTDSYTNKTTAGCRLTITQDGTNLMIGRQLTSTTVKSMALLDAVISMHTYIMPTANQDDPAGWADIVIGTGLGDHAVPTKLLPRGVEFTEMHAPLRPASPGV